MRIDKSFFWSLLIFITINILLYLFIYFFNGFVLFNAYNYPHNAHHYLKDPRIENNKFDLLRALGQFDAQWYLKIGNEGYPKNPTNTNMADKYILDGLSYAFFPLYPLLLFLINIPFKNIELAAFISSNMLILVNFISLYILLKSLYTKTEVFKTIFLLFLFPFAVFFRSYFSENLFLFLLIWFSFCLIKRKWIFASILVGLLSITRPSGLFMLVPFLYFLGREAIKWNISFKKIAALFLVALTPFFAWILFCYMQTGNGLYFLSVRANWIPSQIFILHNLAMVLLYLKLPLHAFHYSKIDVISIGLIGFILWKSRKVLRMEFWLISFFLWIGPLSTTDTMSFSRYQIVSFPLFLYLAQKLKGIAYTTLLSIFCVGLFILSLFFVNWYWLG